MTAASVFRERGLAGRSEEASLDRAVLADALNLAARALRKTSDPSLSAAIDAHWGTVSACAPSTSTSGGKVLASRLRQFEISLRKLGAEADGLAAGEEGSTKEEAAHRVCMRDIESIFLALDAFVGCTHRKLIEDLSAPIVLLETAHHHEHQTTDMLDIAAISGTCRIDDAEGPVSIVGLGFRDDGVDWTSLCQLPYVLMHELVCHAYQGLVGEGRKPASTGCGWSEGWMDALAFRLLETWLGTASTGLPDWLLENKGAVLRISGTLHDRRREPQSSSQPVDLEQRIALHTAAGNLERLLRGESRRPAVGFSRLLAFSFSVNLLSIPQAERNETMDCLAAALELFYGERLDRVVSACRGFTDHGDWRIFRRELETLTG